MRYFEQKNFDAVRDAIAEAIGVCAYDCTRVWEAWSFRTMTSDDFDPIVECEERIVEITQAAMEAVKKLRVVAPLKWTYSGTGEDACIYVNTIVGRFEVIKMVNGWATFKDGTKLIQFRSNTDDSFNRARNFADEYFAAMIKDVLT